MGLADKYVAPKLSHQSRALAGCGIPNSVRSFCTHNISTVAFAKALYYASVEDLETVGCFLAVQEIKLSPRNTAKPPVDLLSSTQPAQSALENALTSVDLDLRILSPRFTVPRTYLRILFMVLQCTVVGVCKNWHTLFTAKAISGRVNVKYWRAPTTLR